jgi:hypothetical protein
MLTDKQRLMVNKLIKISEASKLETSNRLVQTWRTNDIARVMGLIFPELTEINSVELEKQIALSIYQ